MENTTETSAQPIVPAETEVKVSTVTNEDLEARALALEVEKARILEERDNYKNAYLKEKGKKDFSSDDISDEDKDIRDVVREELAKSRLAEIAQQQKEIAQKALKENTELKLALSNKSGIQTQAASGSHVESQQVKDTLITPEQMKELVKRGFTEKDIERYKKNLQARR